MTTDKPVVYVSYSPFDLRHDQQHLALLLERLGEELRLLHKGEVTLFFDRGISPGEKWETIIDDYLKSARAFLALLTPKYFKSSYCRREAHRFFAIEDSLGRNDMLIPVLYLGNRERLMKGSSLGQRLAEREALDWRELRFERPGSDLVGREMKKAVERIDKVLHGTSRS